MAKQTFRIEWDAHEYEHKERSADWYWAVGIVAVSGAIASVIFGNIIFAILLLLSIFSLTLFVNRPPAITHVTINEVGIQRGAVLYPYSTLRSFWIDDVSEHKKIILRSEKLLMPLIVVPLGDMSPERIRNSLLRELPEEYLTLPLLERALEYFGF